jgi:hypothetical protein
MSPPNSVESPAIKFTEPPVKALFPDAIIASPEEPAELSPVDMEIAPLLMPEPDTPVTIEIIPLIDSTDDEVATDRDEVPCKVSIPLFEVSPDCPVTTEIEPLSLVEPDPVDNMMSPTVCPLVDVPPVDRSIEPEDEPVDPVDISI